jgi:NADH-quinone oxidoreductase subunit J
MFSLNMLFYLFSIFLVISAFMVILSQHPMFSLLFLVASFIFSAFLLFILECEFLALLFIIVYVGAIAILFLFIVMMLESKLNNLLKNSMKYIPVGFVFSFFLLTPLFREISIHFESSYDSNCFYLNTYQNWYDLIDSVTDIEVYGQVLYSYYVLQFLISGLILLLILVGIVYLTNTFVTQQTTDQSLFKQLSRNSKLSFKE